ncbi:hypothetical protein BDZ89DRAFT_273094 [Hymenopellis radicata]|nr:hypothetical protein BDZ89DRAFT_273094 [Hymenopellis radicata]
MLPARKCSSGMNYQLDIVVCAPARHRDFSHAVAGIWLLAPENARNYNKRLLIRDCTYTEEQTRMILQEGWKKPVGSDTNNPTGVVE